MPLNCLGVDAKTTFIEPTCINAKPMAIKTRTAAIDTWVACINKRIKNPIVVIIVPITVGLKFPILDITKPEAIENIRETIM